MRIWQWPVSAQYGERKGEYQFGMVDDSFLDVFDFPFVRGDPEIAFHTPNSVVITDDMARHLFGDDDPMGQTFSIETSFFRRIYSYRHRKGATSLIRPLFSNTLNHRDASIGNAGDLDNVAAYACVAPCKDICAIEGWAKCRNPANENAIAYRAVYGDEVAAKTAFHLQPIHRVYLYGESDFNPTAGGRIQRIYILATIGMIVVVIACVNFTNLATARAVTRKREVGVRKVVGAHRPQLMVQFLGESLLLTWAALLIALALVDIFLPMFNQFVPADLHLHAATVISCTPAVIALTLSGRTSWQGRIRRFSSPPFAR